MWCHFAFKSRVLMSVSYVLTLAIMCWISLCITGDEFDFELEYTEPPRTTILPDSPQFVVKLPDKHLLCFAIEGYEMFTYNLITSNYLVLNGFVTIGPSTGSKDVATDMVYNKTRGFGDIGMIVKAVDRRVRAGKRFFRHTIYGERKKAVLGGFGEVDLNKGAITFAVTDGRSSIESQQSPHEEFRLVMDKPKMEIVMVSTNGHTYNVYVEDGSGLLGVDTHGIIGQFFDQKVRVDETSRKLRLKDGKEVPVEEGVVFKDVVDHGYREKTCWYPVEGQPVLEGQSWNYIIEHIMSTRSKYSLYKN